MFGRWCLNGGVNVLAQGSIARTRFAGSALKWCAGLRMMQTTRTRTRILLVATRGLAASFTASHFRALDNLHDPCGASSGTRF
eukprot:COSAG01_NODE_3932_length_5522_cov_153.687258_1_plen_83_part_00